MSSTTLSGGSPPWLCAEVHRAAGRVEAQPDPAGRVDLGAEQVAAVVRKDVVVIGASSCSPVFASQPSAPVAAVRVMSASSSPHTG